MSSAIFLPVLAREKNVLGSPVIIFFARSDLKGLSNLRESGHFLILEKEKFSGKSEKHFFTNSSKEHSLGKE